MSDTSSITWGRTADRIGVALSFGCLIHCIVMPFLIPLLPLLGFMADERIHGFLAVTLFAIAGFSFIRGYRFHRKVSIVVMGLSGVCLLFAGASLPESAPAWGEAGLTSAGGMLLISAHILNIRHCRCVLRGPCACESASL